MHRSAPPDRAGAASRIGVGVDAALVGRPLDRPAGQVGDQLVEAVDVAAHGVEVDEALVEQHARASPLSRAMSPRGRTGRWRSAIIAVFVTRGSTTMTRGGPPSPITRGASSGWLSAMLAPHSTMTSASVEVVVAAGRAVAAEAELVAGHRARHAQRGVAVVVGEAHAEPDQLAQRVELLGHELAGRQHRHRLGPVLRRAGRGTRSTTRSSASSQDAGRPSTVGVGEPAVGRRASGARTGPSGTAGPG